MNTRTRNSIISIVGPKAEMRKELEHIVVDSFECLCDVLKGLADEYNKILNRKTTVIFERAASHVAKFTIDADVLVFSQHTDIFQFDRDHKVWQTPYVNEDQTRTFTGVVNVYNFLTDSFRYDRDEDYGYLVARVFVNKDNSYFVEGKRQRSTGVEHFGEAKLDSNNWRRVVETALKYVVEFDALVPPYETVAVTDMVHLKQAILTSKTKTAKRLGFSFNSDDVK